VRGPAFGIRLAIVLGLAMTTAACSTSRLFSVQEDGTVTLNIEHEDYLSDAEWDARLVFDKDGRCTAFSGSGNASAVAKAKSWCKDEPGALQRCVEEMQRTGLRYSVCEVRDGACWGTDTIPDALTSAPAPAPTDPDYTPGGPTTGGVPHE
jgi:hypothetical protein